MASHWLVVRPHFLLALTAIVCYFVEKGFQTDEISICPMEETHCMTWSCQDRILSPHGVDLDRFPCRCDTLCVIYGDCCVDYFDHCVNDTHFPITSSYADFFECITPFREFPKENYVLVARCPPSWPQDNIRQYCENATLAQSQTLLKVPVNGPDDVTFKNVYCSVCHQVPANRLESWRVNILDCDLYDEEGRLTLDEHLCGVRVLEPSSSQAHRCYRNMVDACPPTAPPSQAAICENHTSIIHSYDGSSFKNVYCADCNNHTRDNLVCSPFTGNSLLDVAFSFSLLFDFTVNVVSAREELWSTPVGPAQNLGTCNTWEIYDPFQNQCRILRCPVNTILQGESCVEYQTNQALSDSSPTYTSRTGDCSQQILFQDFILNHLEVNLTKLVDFSIEHTRSKQETEIYIRADFSIAVGVDDVMERIIYNQTLIDAASVQCNTTAFTLISAFKAATNPSGSPVCDGFAIQHVALTDVTDGVFAVNGYMYDRLEFMHVTVYEFANEDVKKGTSVRLCSPFLNKGCPVMSLNRSEFIVSGSIRGRIFHHVASGRSIPEKDVWLLPDGSVRVCDFLSNVTSSAALPAWLTTLSDFSVASGTCSLFFLVKTFITYLVFPVLRNQPGQIVMNLIAALILAQSVLMTGGISVSWLCTLRATVLHFAWLTVFLWMSIMAWDISYRMKLNRLISVRDEPLGGHKVLKLGLFAWGLPFSFVSVSYLMSRLSQDQSWTWLEYGGSNCWIRDPLHSLLAFGVPVAVIILINCVLVVFMIYKVIVNRKRLAAAQMARSVRTELLLCSKITVLTGMTWTLFLAANLLDIVAIWYISVVANSLQGALIGIIFLWNENVRSLWRQKLFRRGGNSSQGSRSAPSKETAPPSNLVMDILTK